MTTLFAVKTNQAEPDIKKMRRRKNIHPTHLHFEAGRRLPPGG
jgi:hypothetical protein